MRNPIVTQYIRAEWLDRFADDLSSGQAYKNIYNKDSSLLEQIYGLIGQKKSFSTVEDKVKDMQDRVGLTAYLKRQAQEATSGPFDRFEQNVKNKINTFIKNKLETHKGNLPILSLQDSIIELFRRDGVELTDVYSDETSEWLKKMVNEEKNKHPKNEEDMSFLGKATPSQEVDDAANTDFFLSMKKR